MDFLILTAVVAGLVFIVGGWGLSGWQVHRANKVDNTAQSLLTSSATTYWFSLSDAQQQKLMSLATLVDQEVFVSETAAPDVLMKTVPERIVISLANQGFILMGSGVPQRLASVTDFIVATPPRVSFQRRKQQVKSALLKEEQMVYQKRSPLRRNFRHK